MAATIARTVAPAPSPSAPQAVFHARGLTKTYLMGEVQVHALQGVDLPSLDLDDDGDPMLRKLELAEEFRQIGDKDGARDLLREGLAHASGVTKSKAQNMLDDVG